MVKLFYFNYFKIAYYTLISQDISSFSNDNFDIKEWVNETLKAGETPDKKDVRHSNHFTNNKIEHFLNLLAE